MKDSKLGNGFLPFKEARVMARSLNLKSSREWQDLLKQRNPEEKLKDTMSVSGRRMSVKMFQKTSLLDFFGSEEEDHDQRKAKKDATIGAQIKSIVPDGTTKAEYDDFHIIEAYQRLVAGNMLHNLIKKQLRNKGGIMEGQIVEGFLEDVKANLFQKSLMRFNPDKNDDFGGFVIKELTSYSIPNIIKEYKKQGKIVSVESDIPASNPAEPVPIPLNDDEGSMDLTDKILNKHQELMKLDKVIKTIRNKYPDFTVLEGFRIAEKKRSDIVSSLEKLNQSYRESWLEFGKPSNIPSNPNKTYKGKGWIDWPDWLGYKRIDFLDFKEARAIVRGEKLKSKKEWQSWLKSGHRPNNIPSVPQKIYKDKGWKDWADWLGYKNVDFLRFEVAREVARSLNLKSQKDWHVWSKSGKRFKSMPSNPSKIYRDKGWSGWTDWLGK